MKKVNLFCFLFFVFSYFFAINNFGQKIHSDIITSQSLNNITENLENSSWFKQVNEHIYKSEYYITYSEEYKSYQSPNRKQNLRFIYNENGFTAQPRQTKIPLFDVQDLTIKEKEKRYLEIADWRIRFSLDCFGREGNYSEFSGKDLKVNMNYAEIEDANLKITYLNNEEGMRQNFEVENKPEGKGQLRLLMEMESELKMRVGADALAFVDEQGQEQIKYSQLKVWDKEGKILRGWFEKAGQNRVAIVVNDEYAVYPITIDPLSTTSNWTSESDQAGANFGMSVSTAGDVNGDGYSDVIIGAWKYDNGETDEGRAFVYHGSSSGLSTIADWTVEGDQAGAFFGFSVSTAGDVNGDGFSDIIVGAYNYDNSETNEGRAFVYHGSLSGLSITENWTAESNQLNAFYGMSVSTAGDVNGDGFSDVIVGALQYDNGQTDEGRAFVYYGSSSGLSITENWTAEINQASSGFGRLVSTAGDVNGDGFSDIIVGAYRYTNPEVNEGRVFVYYGSSSGLSPTENWTAESNQSVAQFGISASTAGDVNGDGFSDIIIGAYGYDNSETDEGMVFVYYGSSSGLSQTADWTAESNQTNTWFGFSVSTAGDVNGDGYSDIIIGAPNYDNSETDEGRAFVYYGSSSGLSITANWTTEGNQVSANFGRSVSTAGDVNGDGYSDVIIGAPNYDNSETDEGRAFVYHGSSSGLSITVDWTAVGNSDYDNFGSSVSAAGDINGDGYSDVIIGAPYYDNGETDEGRVFVYQGSSSGLSITANWTAESNQTSTWFGSSVSSAGDVNGDGYSDVIVGAPLYDNVGTDEGKVFVYHGSSSGLSTTTNWTTEGNSDYDNFGRSVSTAGDVNGDGYSDVIIGAHNYDNSETDEGRAFVYYGSSSGLSTTENWTAESNQVSARFGFSVSSAGDVNGDGYSDVIVGAIYYDNVETDEGRVFVYHGSSSGLSTTANWTAESNQEGAEFGYSVSTAGDVNGDGYSDVIIVADLYDNGETDEGRVFVYYGSSSGLSVTENWTAESNQESIYTGIQSVSTAGDVNGDGYSDLIIGAPTYDDGATDNGKVFVYHGNSSGLSITPNWTAEGNQDYANFGRSVSTAGDVNGDGYSDVIIGAPTYDDGATDNGKVFVYYGNSSSGVKVRIQQYQFGSSNIIGPDGHVTLDGQIRFYNYVKSPFGRTKGKLVYEYKRTGESFNGLPITNSTLSTGEGNFVDLGTIGTDLNIDVNGIPTYSNYRWRARVKYDVVSNPYQIFGPWRYYEVYQPKSFGSFKSQIDPLPVELTSFTANIITEGTQNFVSLHWQTATEVNNYGFDVEKKAPLNLPEGETYGDWESIGFVEGNGNSNSPKEYSFVDEDIQNQPNGKYYYRLKQIDTDGSYGYSSTIEIDWTNGITDVNDDSNLPKEFSLSQNYPNPFNPTTKIKYSIPSFVETHSNVSHQNGISVKLKIYNIMGQEIATLVNEVKSPGNYEVEFNGKGLSSGMYFYKIEAGSFVDVKKMILLK